MARILLVDDDVELSDMLQEYLLRDHFAVEIAHDGETGVSRALSGEVRPRRARRHDARRGRRGSAAPHPAAEPRSRC